MFKVLKDQACNFQLHKLMADSSAAGSAKTEVSAIVLFYVRQSLWP